MKKQTVYQLDSRGKVKVWSISVKDEMACAVIIVEHGLKDGKITIEEERITSGKNAGKTNATGAFEQAVLEAESKLKQKIRKGYVEDITQLKSKDQLGSGILAPMLAQKYDPTGKQSSSKTLKQMGIEDQLIGASPKLDGNRCLAKVSLAGVELYTRKGDRFQSIPHIEQQLLKCFEKISEYVKAKYNITEYVIDGELFSSAKKQIVLKPDESIVVDDISYTYEDFVKKFKQ